MKQYYNFPSAGSCQGTFLKPHFKVAANIFDFVSSKVQGSLSTWHKDVKI